jgi:hypothetical protein
MLGHQRGGKGKTARGGGKDQFVHGNSLPRSVECTLIRMGGKSGFVAYL